jgi:hypothetical protein
MRKPDPRTARTDAPSRHRDVYATAVVKFQGRVRVMPGPAYRSAKRFQCGEVAAATDVELEAASCRLKVAEGACAGVV